MRRLFVALSLAAGITLIFVLSSAASGATCSDYPNQAAAQRAHDTRDADHDGIYCESLPCPCSGPSKPHSHHKCKRPRHLVRISFSGTKYPNIRRHFLDAVTAGWPKVLVLNRRGAAARRKRLLAHYPTKKGFDRDEYPPAVGRGRGKGLTRGRNPRG